MRYRTSSAGRNALTLAALAVALAFAPSAVAQQCVKDMDCAGDAICEGGQCVGEDGEPVGAAAPAAPAAPATGGAAASEIGSIPLNVVKVEFLPRGGPVLVTHNGTGRSCMTPCTLEIPAGSQQITIGSDPAIRLTVPSNGGRFTVSQYEVGLTLAGALFTTFGGLSLIPGVMFTIFGNEEDDPDTSFTDESSNLGDLGTIFLAVGGGMLVPGIIMLASADSGGARAATGPRRTYVAKRPRLVPYVQPREGGGMLGVALSF